MKPKKGNWFSWDISQDFFHAQGLCTTLVNKQFKQPLKQDVFTQQQRSLYAFVYNMRQLLAIKPHFTLFEKGGIMYFMLILQGGA